MIVAAEYRIKKNKNDTVLNRTLLCQTRETLSVSDCILQNQTPKSPVGYCTNRFG